MKKIYALLFLFFVSISLWAQASDEKIRLDAGFIDFKYYVGDKVSCDSLMCDEIVDSLMVNANEHEIAELYWKSETKNTLRKTSVALGGFFVGFATFAYIMEESDLADGEENGLWSDPSFLVVAGSGIAMLGISIPLYISAKKNATNAVEKYNSLNTSFHRKSSNNLYLGMTPCSVGLKLRF